MLQEHAARQENELEVSYNHKSTPFDYDDGLLKTAIPLMSLAYGLVYLLSAITFYQASSRDIITLLAACIFYTVIYFGVPITMHKMRVKYDVRFKAQTLAVNSDTISTFTGKIKRSEALWQMLTIPLVIAFAFIAFAIMIFQIRP